MAWRAGAAAGAGALVLLWLSPQPARGRVFPDAPPTARTGGFGEQTCRQCHFTGDENEPGGRLTLGGVPAQYRPGERYRIVVSLERGEMKVGGFQLSARFAEGASAGQQAGNLLATDERTKVTADSASAVEYASHVLPGIQLSAEGKIEWTVEWTAPSSGGPVVFHAAGNAGDGDGSPLGDLVYTTSQTSQAP